MANRRRATVAAGLVTLVVALLGATPAEAATDDLSVAITGLSPSSLGRDSTVTLQGQVTNTGSKTWTDVQAYMVIRPTPLTSRADLADAVSGDQGFAGPRIVDAGRFDELGDLPAGASTSFRIEVPADDLDLRISGDDGIYPVGVQVLGTSPKGKRSNEAVARATTLLPRMLGDHPAAPTTVVWTFLMPTPRTADDRLADPAGLLALMRPEGRLHRLLDLALSTDAGGRGAIVDPALIDAADDLAEGRGTAGDVSEEDQVAAGEFRDDLVRLATEPSSWILDYDRTDVLAVASDAAVRTRLFGAVERATDSVVARHSLSSGRVAWPSRDSVNETLTRALRERGDDPVIVSSTQLRGWEPSDGVLLRRSTSRGDLPLLVNDEVTRDLPGPTTAITVRQQVMASAALASLGRGAALVIVDPEIDPASLTSSSFVSSYLEPRSLDQVRAAGRYSGRFPGADVRPVGRSQLAAADAAAQAADLLSAAASESAALDNAQARALAGVLGLRWRTDRAGGIKQARSVQHRFEADLDSLTVMAPPTVTLSSNTGGFPLTISNGSDQDISVGVQLDSSNPALDLPDQEPVEIGAGERQTVTVDVDLQEQNATTVTARLTTPDGRAFGSSEEFIVKSSRVGFYLWATMGAAGLFVLFALIRRFTRRRTGDSEPFPDDE